MTEAGARKGYTVQITRGYWPTRLAAECLREAYEVVLPVRQWALPPQSGTAVPGGGNRRLPERWDQEVGA